MEGKQNTIEQLQADVDGSRKSLEEANTQLSALRSQLSEKDAEIEKLQKQIADLRAEVKELSEKPAPMVSGDAGIPAGNGTGEAPKVKTSRVKRGMSYHQIREAMKEDK